MHPDLNGHFISLATRVFLLFVAAVIWLGIWLTGFSTVHWVLYLPAILLPFASTTGICPGLMLSETLFKPKKNKSPKR